jgi:hypothetical protein
MYCTAARSSTFVSQAKRAALPTKPTYWMPWDMHAPAKSSEHGERSTQQVALISPNNSSQVEVLLVSDQNNGTPVETFEIHFFGKSLVSSVNIFNLSSTVMRGKDVLGGVTAPVNVVQCEVSSPAALNPAARDLTLTFPLLMGMAM